MSDPGKLSIVGESSLPGGIYGQVKVVGTLFLSGKLESQELKVVGTLDSEDDIFCSGMNVLGTAKLRNLKVRNYLHVVGTTTVQEINAEKVSVSGELTAEDKIECGHLEVKGLVRAGNFLGADTLSIKSRYTSRVKDAGGKEIRVRGRLFSKKIVFSAGTVEFDTIDIENTKASVVRGKHVTLGKNCSVDLVEYSDTLERHPGARIGTSVKI